MSTNTIDLSALYKELLSSLTSALSQIFVDKWPAVKELALGYLGQAEQRFRDLATQYQIGEENGGISKQFLLDRLDEEKDILKAELLSFAVLGEAVAEAAANQAIQIIENAILALKN